MSNPLIRLSLPRAAASWLPGLALILGLTASGDRAVWSAGPGNAGIDPLEILNLAVRPNALFVLDSSGSMGETVTGTGGLADDDPDTKIAIAKKVIRDVIAVNQTKVSFQFGQYDQGASTIPINTQTTQNAGSTRFQYTVKNATFATEPSVQLRLFEVPTGSNWTVAFANGNTNYTTAAIPARVYTGTELAQQMATLMNAQDGAGYVGSFSDPAIPGSPVFTFTRTTGTLPFAMRFSLMNATLKNFLRAAAPAGTYLGDTNDVTSPYVIVPNVGTFTTFTLAAPAAPNSFDITGSPSIRIGRGGTNFTTTLTDGTYTGAQMAAHIATRMGVADATTAPPDQFVISGTTVIQIRRGATGTTNHTGTLTNGTYTGAQLAQHISDVMDSADPAALTLADYTGAYNASTGVFSFNRLGTDATSFTIRWASGSSASLRGALAASGGIRAPNTDPADTTSPFSLSTLGGLTATTLYSGSYNTGTGVFTFTRSPAFATSFDILWSNWTASLLTLIGAPGSNATDAAAPFALTTSGLAPVPSVTPGTTTTNTGPANSTAPLVLYRRSDSGTYDMTSGGSRYLSAMANKLFNGQTLSVLANGTPCFLTAGTPVVSPAVPPITVQVVPSCGAAATTTVTFLLRGPTSIVGAGASCGGFRTLVGLADCLNNNQLSSIDTPFLQNDLGFSGSSILGYTETNGVGTSVTQPTQWGIRAAGNTPIAESLIDLRNIFISGIGAQPPTPFVLPLPAVRAIWPVVAAQTKKQRTFVIFVTDGDDTCDDEFGSGLGLSADQNALRAAHKAQQLHTRFVSTEPESSVTTYVIAFGSGAAVNRANWIAWGGSGMKFGPALSGPAQPAPFVATNTGTGAQERWSRIPTQAEKDACATCQDAIPATDPAALSAALQSVIDQGQSSGEFSDQQSITESVYEYVDLAPLPTPNPTVSPIVTPSPFVPLDPQTRFGSSIPILLQSTFVLPAFDGHLKAFRNVGGVATQMWDAGVKLVDRVVNDAGAMGVAGRYTFAELYGNATPSTVRASSARIKRRIFTTSSQGVLGAYTAQNLLSDNASALQGNRIELWPPAAAVAPTANSPAPPGSLDEALGLGVSVTTVAQVQALFSMACLPSSDATPRIHPDCTSGTASVQLARAKREAREAFLAYLAGARVSNVSGAPDRLVNGDVLFQSRPWIMFESTLAAPAVVTPPLEAETLTYHPGEYRLYRDGPRDGAGRAVNGIANGLGLRNPDKESPQTLAATDNFNLKPQMSVIYHATNQGLHAFRAGPCPTTGVSGGFTSLGTLNCAGETGGEELWAFVPFDQLGKLRTLLKIQSRSSKTYLLASPVRISDVFVAGSATQTIGGVAIGAAGVWRTIAVFGRGIAGKSLTALDVTVPGPFTWHSLETRPPIVIWSRGNFDTSDGLVKTGSNTYNHDAADYTAYLGLGETWSVPAVGFVKPSLHITGRRPAGVEFALYLGSGYSDVGAEGKTFFALDALSGDVIQSFLLPDGTVTQTGLTLPNVITGSPAIYTVEGSTQKSPQGYVGVTAFLSNPVEAQAKQVYFGDLHSRIWRYSPLTPGAAPVVLADVSSDSDQPFPNGLSLLDFDSVPLVFASAGRDSRVAVRASPPRFRMYGYSDGPSGNPVAAFAQLFAVDFPANYRGNSSPAAGFIGGDTDNDPATPDVVNPIVFFTGLSFASGSDPLQPCLSRFDSVLFALQGLTGLAALDLNSTSTLQSDDAYATIAGQVLQNPHITTEGTLVIDRGLGAQAAPPPPAPPQEAGAPPTSTTTTSVSTGIRPGTQAFIDLKSTTTPFRVGTAVCNVNP